MNNLINQLVTIWESLHTFIGWIQTTIIQPASGFIPGYIIGLVLLVLLVCVLMVIVHVISAVVRLIAGFII